MEEKHREEGIFGHDYHHELKSIAHSLKEIAHTQKRIAFCLCKLVPSPATGFEITQTGDTMPITGVPAGGQGSFMAVTDPPGSSLQAGNIPVWSVDDSLVSITPSTDGFSVSAAVAASDTAASFNLTIAGISSNGSNIQTVTNVPILPAVTVPATGFVVNQTA